MRAGAKFSARREIVVGLSTYAVYLAVRATIVNERGRRAALHNARLVVEAERRLGVHLEPHLQRASLRRRRALAAANVAYVTLNVGLTVGWLMLLYARRDPRFHPLRRAWVISTLGAQPAFLLFPTAPPRVLEGFTDTIREAGVDLDSGWVAHMYNPLAAMPSIHMSYAEITSAGIASAARSRLLRRVAPAYPPAVALIVLATGNHFVLDVFGGSLLGRVSLALGGRRWRTPQ
jgi:PAP2 superfamily